MGIFGPSKEELKKQEQERMKLAEEASVVKVTTGGISKEYEIKGIVFELGADDGGVVGKLFGTGGSPSIAFERAEQLLKIKAHNLGCDYVINASFDYRIAIGNQSITGGMNQVLEVFAYGTAVKAN